MERPALLQNGELGNLEAGTTKLVTKPFPKPFSIESLIANQTPANTAPPSPPEERDHELEQEPEQEQELSARAMVASSALGLTQFPLYNPWLHGYFAQNHERLTHLIAGGCYLPSTPASHQAPQQPQQQPPPPPPPHALEKQLPPTLPHPLDTRFLPFNPAVAAGVAPTDLSYRRLAELMNQDYVHSLSVHARLQHMAAAGRIQEDPSNPGLVQLQEPMPQLAHSSPAKSGSRSPVEPTLDVGVDEDFECSGDSCSDISLTMSPRNYNGELDKSRNGGG